VLFVENRDLPMIDVSVDFPAGSGYDSAQKSGLAGLTLQMLKLGAEGMTEDEIARKTADVGARLNGRFDTDRAGMRCARSPARASATRRSTFSRKFCNSRNSAHAPHSIGRRPRITVALKRRIPKPDVIAGAHLQPPGVPRTPYGLRGSGEVDIRGQAHARRPVGFYRRIFVADHRGWWRSWAM